MRVSKEKPPTPPLPASRRPLIETGRRPEPACMGCSLWVSPVGWCPFSTLASVKDWLRVSGPLQAVERPSACTGPLPATGNWQGPSEPTTKPFQGQALLHPHLQKQSKKRAKGGTVKEERALRGHGGGSLHGLSSRKSLLGLIPCMKITIGCEASFCQALCVGHLWLAWYGSREN